jgi:CHASE2 domain-containing sensor protein
VNDSISYHFGSPAWALAATQFAVITGVLLVVIAWNVRNNLDRTLLVLFSLFYFWRGGTISFNHAVTYNATIMLAANMCCAGYVLFRILRRKSKNG